MVRAAATMKPLADLAGSLGSVRGLLADIDDTITTDGRVTAAAYAAMERVHDAGLLMIPITGRPAGWCDHIARMWPVDAVVGENGAFYMHYDRKSRNLLTRHVDEVSAIERDARRQRLHSVGERILREVPGAAWASDQAFRIADIAIDFCEDVPRLPPESVQRIADLMRDEGLTARISSIHVNGWYGRYDKLGMTRRLLREVFAIELDVHRDQFVFIGDSPNDSPLFGYFPNSVGVANVTEFESGIEQFPKFVTPSRSGAGFVELATLLVELCVRSKNYV